VASILIKSITPFDALYDNTISFVYTGSQIVKNRLVIKSNATGETVYDQEISSYVASHTIPSGTLQNGSYYTCTVTAYWLVSDQTYDSITSQSASFLCLTTPTWYFDGVSSGSILSSSTLSARLTYEQAEGELLNEYEVLLYSYTGVQLFSTGALYDRTYAATISGLDDNTSYYLRAVGQTVNGMSVDTGRIAVATHFDTLYGGGLLSLVNQYDKGYIDVTSTIAAVDGEASGTVVYLDDKEADLRNGTNVLFSGVNITGEFTCTAYVRDPVLNQNVLSFLNGQTPAYKVYFRSDGNDPHLLLWAEVRQEGTYSTSVYLSDPIAYPDADTPLYLYIAQTDGVLDVVLQTAEVDS